MNVVFASRRSQLRFEALASRAGDQFGLLPGHAALAQEALQIGVPHRLALLDGLILQRLREARLVGFVVAPAPVAVHVDHDVALVLVPKVDRQTDNLGRRFRVFSVHVKDWNLQHLRDAAGVDRRAGLPVGRRDPIWLLMMT